MPRNHKVKKIVSPKMESIKKILLENTDGKLPRYIKNQQAYENMVSKGDAYLKDRFRNISNENIQEYLTQIFNTSTNSQLPYHTKLFLTKLALLPPNTIKEFIDSYINQTLNYNEYFRHFVNQNITVFDENILNINRENQNITKLKKALDFYSKLIKYYTLNLPRDFRKKVSEIIINLSGIYKDAVIYYDKNNLQATMMNIFDDKYDLEDFIYFSKLFLGTREEIYIPKQGNVIMEEIDHDTRKKEYTIEKKKRKRTKTNNVVYPLKQTVRQIRIKAISSERFDDNDKKYARNILSFMLSNVNPYLPEYDINSIYIKEIISSIDTSLNRKEFYTKIYKLYGFLLKQHHNKSNIENMNDNNEYVSIEQRKDQNWDDTFYSNIKNGIYSPEQILNLPNQEMLPEVFDNTRIKQEEQESVLNDIKRVIEIYLDIEYDRIYYTQNGSTHTNVRKLSIWDLIDFSRKNKIQHECENIELDAKLIYHDIEYNKFYCISIKNLNTNFLRGDYINYISNRRFSQKFIDNVNKYYNFSSHDVVYVDPNSNIQYRYDRHSLYKRFKQEDYINPQSGLTFSKEFIDTINKHYMVEDNEETKQYEEDRADENGDEDKDIKKITKYFYESVVETIRELEADIMKDTDEDSIESSSDTDEDSTVSDSSDTVESPVVENPSDESPVVENPSVKSPVVENPSDESPVVENPSDENARRTQKLNIEHICSYCNIVLKDTADIIKSMKYDKTRHGSIVRFCNTKCAEQHNFHE
jgi:hypothetical protein